MWVLSCILILATLGNAQNISIPVPRICVPFSQHNENILSTGMFSADSYVQIDDRFGNKLQAISVTKCTYQVSPMDSLSVDLSIAFWLHYDGKNGCVIRVLDNNGNTLTGLSIYDRLPNLHLYHTLGNQKLNDVQHFWKRCKFNEEGWYFITLSFGNEGVNVYSTSPDGTTARFFSSFTLDPKEIKSLELSDGCKNGIDDICIYNVALTESQHVALYTALSQHTIGSVSYFNKGSERYLLNGDCYIVPAGLDNGIPEYYIRHNNTFLGTNGLDVVDSNSTQPTSWNIIQVDKNYEAYHIVHHDTNNRLEDSSALFLSYASDNTPSQMWLIKQQESKSFVSPTAPEMNIKWDETSQTLAIKINNVHEGMLSIANERGVNLHREKVNGTHIAKSVKIPSSGVYIVTLSSANQQHSQKISITF